MSIYLKCRVPWIFNTSYLNITYGEHYLFLELIYKKDEVELFIHFYVQLFIYFYVKDISFLIEKVNKLFIVQYLTNAESTCNSTICKDLPVK